MALSGSGLGARVVLVGTTKQHWGGSSNHSEQGQIEVERLPRYAWSDSPDGAGEAAALVVAAVRISARAGGDQAAGDRETGCVAGPDRQSGSADETRGPRPTRHAQTGELRARNPWQSSRVD